MIIHKLNFNQLSNQQLYDILKLRQDVFIIEQNCFYEDIDNNDNAAFHILFYEDNNLIAYSRLFAPNIMFEHACAIGRIIVKNTHRLRGFGHLVMKESINWCETNYPGIDIAIEAQAHLKRYYANFGFEAIGDEYDLDGIKHLIMRIRP